MKVTQMLQKRQRMRSDGRAMVVGIKDSVKLAGISIVSCCAVFVCTLFLNYNIDLPAIKGRITTEAGMAMFDAQVLTGKVVVCVTGCCLVLTSAVMLLFYVKNYIDAHGKELGILKALGYSELKIARHFWVFGVSVLTGCAIGFAAAFLYLPDFYELQNEAGLFPELPVQFHSLLAFFLIVAPAMVFAVLSVLYAYGKLTKPVLDLLREKREYNLKYKKESTKELSFLQDLRRNTVRSKKSLVFFVTFLSFCFSAMVQMSTSMKDLSSEAMGFLIFAIGIILAFMTLFLSLSSVVKGNTKTIAMMKVFGYENTACGRAVFSGYRPFSYLGFALGTVYQYVLLKLTVSVLFKDIENLPEYRFDYKVCAITFVVFILVYEMVMYSYARQIRKLSVKHVMMES